MKCKDCNKCVRDRRYTKDSWEEEYDWKCGLKDNTLIQEWVAWNESDRVKTPSWCPLIEAEKEVCSVKDLKGNHCPNKPTVKLETSFGILPLCAICHNNIILGAYPEIKIKDNR